MNILLAEDDPVAGRTLRAILEAQGHGVDVAVNGVEAWGLWQLTGHRIVVSDWLMPEMDGLELCRRIRRRTPPPYTYVVLQTIRSGLDSFLEAMEAGVDDFITKPVAPEELVARLRVAERILGVREELLTLEGLLAICTYCKRLRTDHNAWIPLEQYVAEHSTAQFSHGVCPDCYDKYLKPQLEGL